MKVRCCEACGNPIWDAEPGQLLCDLCMKVIDEQTELLLEILHFEGSFDDLFDEFPDE